MLLKISQNSHENTCARASFLIKLQAWGLEVFSYEFCEIFKNNFFYKTPPVAASLTENFQSQLDQNKFCAGVFVN